MEYESLTSLLKILITVTGIIGIGALLARFLYLEWVSWKNGRAGVCSCGAVAYWKDPEVGYLPQGRASSSVHHITFHTDDGQIVSLYMGPRDYYAIEEGSRGRLTWEGTRFWRFETT